MINKIYGNDFALQTMASMFKSGRIPHAFLIYGEKGLGKKKLADFLAAALLCEKQTGTPCGECKACRLTEKHVHPDVIYPEQSGKLNTYTIESCRNVCTDAFLAPNNGDKKIYIFADADNIQLPAQNALLKIVEEPPDPVYFIFTAESKESFLPTILSRVTSIGAASCNEKECITALSEKEYDDKSIKNAMSVFGGNIGKCIEYLENQQLQDITALTKRAVNSIINKDEYSLLAAFSDPLIKERSMCNVFLNMLDLAIRDAAVLKYNDDAVCAGCCKKASLLLSERLSRNSAVKIHRYINQAAADIKANVSTVLVMSALCGEVIES